MARPDVFSEAASASRLLVVVVTMALAASCATSVEVGEPLVPETESVVAVTTPEAVNSRSQCRNEDSFRARLIETDPATDQVLTEFRYEANGDHMREEPAGAERGQIILSDTDAWSFSSSGWVQLPAFPVRPLRSTAGQRCSGQLRHRYCGAFTHQRPGHLRDLR